MSIQIHVCLLLCVIQCLGWFAIGLYIPGNTNDFERNVRRAMETIKDVLDTDKLKVTQISNMPHKYDDKYYLSEFLTNTMIGATTNVLFKIMHGIDLNVEDDAGDRKKLFDFIRNSNKLSLEFQCVESSVFINTTNREVVHKGNKVLVEEEVETKSSGFFGSNQKTKTNEVSRRTTVVEVTEHFWEYSVSYEVVLVSTVNGMKADEYSLTKHNSVVDIVTSVKKNPYEHKRMLPMAIDLSWLKTMLQHQESQGSDISTDVYMSFHIDRGDVECKTPRRNRDISNALEYVSRLHQWALDVTKHLSYFEVKHLSLTEGGRIYCPDSSDSGEIFAPIVPFLLRYADDAGGDADVNHTRKYTKHDIHSVEWSENNIQRLLDMQMHSFDAFVDRAIRPKYPNSFEEARKRGSVYDVHTVSLMTSLVHLATICRLYTQGVDHIEFLIRRQLSDAVGKEVRVSDLTDYMNNFHVDRFFQPKYKLKPFSYAIRKTPMHSPEGSISLEQSANGGVAGYALPTITHYSQAPVSMHLQLNPSTTINFNSNLYVHGWLNHQFRDTDQNRFEIVAEARQFSSYILMFGRIPDLDTFEPLHAIVIKDKDLLRIPLDIELVPSLKAFKAAIESLSPEQKRFASAFRSMQLEHNSLLGLLVIPIKPQLERVLNLPEDALTKELQLNQDLMELFIEYQIPSDLLSCNEGITQFKEEGSNTDALDLSASTKISTVKSYVSSMNNMINESKNQQLAEKERLRDFHEGASRRPNVRMASGEYSEPSSIPSGYPSGVADRIVYKNAASEAIEMDAPVVILAAESSSWGERRGGKDILLSDDGDEFSTGTIVDETLVEVEINPATPQNPINDQSLVDIPYDFTGIPKMLDGRFEHMDVSLSNATTISLRRNDMEELQAMILKPSSTWSRRRQSGLLGKAETTSMTTENIDGEKRMAYELLDALTKGGALPLQQTTLHVIIGSSHTFERTLINTVVQENVNPIEKLEKTLAVMGSIIHNVPIDALVKPEHLGRLL